jgi:hypothetical protein
LNDDDEAGLRLLPGTAAGGVEIIKIPATAPPVLSKSF